MGVVLHALCHVVSSGSPKKKMTTLQSRECWTKRLKRYREALTTNKALCSGFSNAPQWPALSIEQWYKGAIVKCNLASTAWAKQLFYFVFGHPVNGPTIRYKE